MTRFHYVITIQYEAAWGTASATIGGIYEARPGTTRATAFNDLLAYARDTAGVAGDSATTCVLFFSLEPDELVAA
jgi:hypothetical protein